MGVASLSLSLMEKAIRYLGKITPELESSFTNLDAYNLLMKFENFGYTYVVISKRTRVSTIPPCDQELHEPKAVTKQEGPKNFIDAPFFNLFLQLAAEEKDSKSGAGRKFFGPSYFDPTLDGKRCKPGMMNGLGEVGLPRRWQHQRLQKEAGYGRDSHSGGLCTVIQNK